MLVFPNSIEGKAREVGLSRGSGLGAGGADGASGGGWWHPQLAVATGQWWAGGVTVEEKIYKDRKGKLGQLCICKIFKMVYSYIKYFF